MTSGTGVFKDPTVAQVLTRSQIVDLELCYLDNAFYSIWRVELQLRGGESVISCLQRSAQIFLIAKTRIKSKILSFIAGGHTRILDFILKHTRVQRYWSHVTISRHSQWYTFFFTRTSAHLNS